MAAPPIRIGVLLLAPTQLLDVSPVDLFSMFTKDYLSACRLPQPLINGALPVEITYISESGSGSIAECTASAGLRVSAGLKDAGSAPGQLDILLVPGPDPAMVPSENVRRFLRSHAEKMTTILSVCTGIFPVAHAGLVKGKQATGPRALLPELTKKFPDTEWRDKRWVHQGNVWTSAGITNGMDMVAAYIRETWPGPTAEAVLAMADVGDRGPKYPSGQASENVWWLWQILRAWFGNSAK